MLRNINTKLVIIVQLVKKLSLYGQADHLQNTSLQSVLSTCTSKYDICRLPMIHLARFNTY